MTPAEALAGAAVFATVVTFIVNTIISAYTDDPKNEGDE
jgi:hypothetical protein